MPIEDPAPGRGPASSSVSQPADNHFFNGIPLSGIRGMILDSVNGVRNAMYGYFTDPAPSDGTPDEPIQLRSQSSNDEQVLRDGHSPETALEQPPRIHNITFASEGDDPEEARQQAAGGENDSDGAPLTFKSTSTWMKILIIGIFSLIIIPGLVLGSVTGQVQWGIALSGAVGTIVGVFAGLYYHHNKRD